MRVIGLTGGIGSGKSTVAQLLGELGAAVIDLDKVGHEAIKPGTEAWQGVVEAFGKDILNVGGEIDRSRLAEVVFKDKAALRRLNHIVHPVIDNLVRARLEEYRRQNYPVVVLEAAAMLEAGRAADVDEVWVTVAPEKAVLERLAERSDYSEEESKARIRSQLASDERVKQADVVIDTDGDLKELKARVVVLWHQLIARIDS
ncbi:MAG: dephospho-CoA kinase [Chloroflexota bacterium]